MAFEWLRDAFYKVYDPELIEKAKKEYDQCRSRKEADEVLKKYGFNVPSKAQVKS